MFDHSLNERLVDLDLVEWKPPQIAERRVSRPEIVHRYPHPKSPQGEQRPHDVGVVLQQDRLRDLQLQPASGQARQLQCGLDMFGDGAVPELELARG